MRRRAIFRILGILGLAGALLYLLPSLPLASRAETGHLMKIHSNFSKDCSLAALRSSVLMSSEPDLNAHLQKCKSTLDDLRRLATAGAALDQRITVQYGFPRSRCLNGSRGEGKATMQGANRRVLVFDGTGL